jgi:hypothetical protein
LRLAKRVEACDAERRRQMILCDSCGRPADPQHIRERIERLELATRFRPVHIRALLIDAAPPLHAEDYFYRAPNGQSTSGSADRSVDGAARSEASRTYFNRILACAGSQRATEEVALGEFQRQGLFLTYAVECPVENSAELSSVLKQAAPNLVKRVQFSYKPKFIALLSRDLGELVPVLQSGWGDRLILDGASPFAGAESETSGVSPSQSSNSADRLAEAIRRLP